MLFPTRWSCVRLKAMTMMYSTKPSLPQIEKHMYHDDVCDYCLSSVAGPLQALPIEEGFPVDKYTLPFTDKFWPKYESVLCHHCNIEKYCSVQCRENAYISYHNLMCPGPAPSQDHPILMLQNLCTKYDTNFPLQAAKMMAMAYNLYDQLQGKDELKVYEESPFSKFATSKTPLSFFDSLGQEYKDFVYEKAYKYIQEVLGKEKKYPNLMSKETYWQLFNSIHLNCSQVTPLSPFMVYIAHITRIRPIEKMKTIAEYIENMNTFAANQLDMETAGASEMVFQKRTKSVGSALFSLHSQMNHSCQPNVKVVTNRYSSAKIEVVAQKSILKGEEICIDYIGFNLQKSFKVYDERQKIIQDRYSFLCECKICRQYI